MLPPALPAFVGLLLLTHEVSLWDVPEAHLSFIPRWLRLALAVSALLLGGIDAAKVFT